MIGWAGSALVIAGRFLLAHDMAAGFWVGATGDVSWMIYGWQRKLWPLLFLDIVLLSADLLGVYLHY